MKRLRAPIVVSLALLGAAAAGVSATHGAAASPVRGGTAASPVRGAAASTRGPQALVTDEAQNRLLVVDLPSGRIARSLPVPADPEDIAASFGGGGVVIVVSSRAGKVTILDRDTLRVVKTFAGFQEPHIVAISPDDSYAYVSDDSRGTLSAIRLRGPHDMRLVGTVSVGVGAHHMAFSPNERTVWVALGENATRITILSTVVPGARVPGSEASTPITDLGHPHVVGSFSPGFPAHDLSFSPDGRQVWVTSAAGPDVTAFDARSHRVLFRVPVGAPPQHIVFQGRYAYLTSGYGSTIEKVSTSGRIVARSSAPYGSFELAAADGYVVSSSLLRGTLAIYTPNLELRRVVTLAPETREVAISRP